jgi:outer membrane protein TolC
MRCFFLIRKTCYFIFWTVAAVCILGGCEQHNYKAEADEKVYTFIDQKWSDNIGTKANYKISDTPPSPNDIRIDKSIPASGVITLPRAVAVATAHNRDYQNQRELLYISALDLRLARHKFETQYFGGLSGGYNADRNDQAWGLEANLGFNRLVKTGALITTKVSAAWLDILTGNIEGGLNSILTANITQPLLRGSDPTVVLEDLTQAERDALYQIRSFNRYRKTFVVSVVTQYYQILELYNLAANAETNYKTLSWLYQRVEKLTNAGRLPTFELDRIRQEMLKAQDEYIQVHKEYESVLDSFKITLGLPTTTEFQLDASVLEELRATNDYPEFDEAEAIETALFRRLDLTNSADAVLDAQRKVYVAADALRTELNLTGGVDAVSSGASSRRTLKAEENYNLDLELGLPLDRVAEQNIYRKALITLNQRQREYELAADTISLEVRQAYRDLAEAIERYRLQSDALSTAQERFRKTYLLMQYARASSRRVLDAQRDLYEAQNEATQALVNYAIATLNFYRDVGVLHVRPDGMWDKGVN